MEFEQGDPDYPIWTGGFWGLVADVPIFATAPPAIPPGQNIVLQTTGQNMIMVSDAPPTPVTGGIVLKSVSGAMIVVNETGIYISNGQGATITLIGPAVDINLGATDGGLSDARTDLAYWARSCCARTADRRCRPLPARACWSRACRSRRSPRPMRWRDARLCRPPATGRASPRQWVVGAVRVTSLGQPVVIMTGVAICAPTGTPLVPVEAQTRVLAT